MSVSTVDAKSVCPGEGIAPRPKVLFVTRKWPPAVGGMELYSREIAAAMARHADVDVIALPGRPDGSPPSMMALLVFLAATAARLGARARRYDVVHFGDFVLFPLAVWTSLVAPRTRRLVTVHGLDLLYGRRTGWKPLIYRAYLRVACRMQGTVHRFVANSHATAGAAAGMGIAGAVPIPLGITLEPEKCTGNGTDTDGAIVDQEDGRYILFVGRIVPRKGLAWFAESVLPTLPEDVTLKIVGTVWNKVELHRALDNPRAEYLGRVDDAELLRLRRGAAVTVMPNRHLDEADMEGFGLAALEAAANGSILVASGIEGIVDAVVDGETGFLLPEGDAERWAQRLNEVLAWSPADRQAFVDRARRVIAERYSWDRVARQTLQLAETNIQAAHEL